MMKKLFGNLNRRASQSLERTPTYPDDSPEGNLLKELKAFCESGGGNGQTGDEYLHLPAIVDAAESSPSAAREAANRIRKYLSTPATAKGYIQYNAIMLIRILADNPGATFTRNIDSRFVTTVRELLKEGRDMSVQQMLRETLEALQVQKSEDVNLAPLVEMWKKEKEKMEKKFGTNGGVTPIPEGSVSAPYAPTQENYTGRQRRSRALPPPDELAARVQEARTSAKLLLQLVQSTPPAEVLNNELIKEFAARCQSASRSITTYINCENPAPDEDTMLTLIETSDQLSVSMSKHHRAILGARKTAATAPSPTPAAATLPPLQASQPLNYEPPAPSSYDTRQPTQSTVAAATALPRTTSTSGGYHYNPDDFQIQNPFADSNANPDSHAEQPYGGRNYSNGDNGIPPTNTTAGPSSSNNYTAYQPPTPPQPIGYGAIDSTANSNPGPISIPPLPPISTPSSQHQYQNYYPQDAPQSQFAVTPPRPYVPYNSGGAAGGDRGVGGDRTPSITQDSMIVSAFPPSSSGSGGGGSRRGMGTGSGGGGGGGGAGGDPSSYPFSPISPLDARDTRVPRY